jgi:hypothetical protein
VFKKLFLGVSLLALTAQNPVVEKDVRYPIPRSTGEGQRWLSWSADQRQSFISGFLTGYTVGFRTGCTEYSFADPPKDGLDLNKSPLQKCMIQELDYSKMPKDYAIRITAFYERYPADADVPTTWLVLALSDSEHKSFEEIHTAWADGHRSP